MQKKNIIGLFLAIAMIFSSIIAPTVEVYASGMGTAVVDQEEGIDENSVAQEIIETTKKEEALTNVNDVVVNQKKEVLSDEGNVDTGENSLVVTATAGDKTYTFGDKSDADRPREKFAINDKIRINIKAKYSGGGAREIEVKIPEGYKIVAASAKEDTKLPAGISNNGITSGEFYSLIEVTGYNDKSDPYIVNQYIYPDAVAKTIYKGKGDIKYTFRTLNNVELAIDILPQNEMYNYSYKYDMTADPFGEITEENTLRGQNLEDIVVSSKLVSGPENTSFEKALSTKLIGRVGADGFGSYRLHESYNVANVVLDDKGNSTVNFEPFGLHVFAQGEGGTDAIYAYEDFQIKYIYPEFMNFERFVETETSVIMAKAGVTPEIVEHGTYTKLNSKFKDQFSGYKYTTVSYKNVLANNGLFRDFSKPSFSVDGSKLGDVDKSFKIYGEAAVKIKSADDWILLTDSTPKIVNVLSEDAGIRVVQRKEAFTLRDGAELGYEGYQFLGNFGYENQNLVDVENVNLEWKFSEGLRPRILYLEVTPNTVLTDAIITLGDGSTVNIDYKTSGNSGSIIISLDNLKIDKNSYIKEITGVLNRIEKGYDGLNNAEAYINRGFAAMGHFAPEVLATSQTLKLGNSVAKLDININRDKNASPIVAAGMNNQPLAKPSYGPNEMVNIKSNVYQYVPGVGKYMDNFVYNPTFYIRVPKGFEFIRGNKDYLKINLLDDPNFQENRVDITDYFKSYAKEGPDMTIYEYVLKDEYKNKIALGTKPEWLNSGRLSKTVLQIDLNLKVDPSNLISTEVLPRDILWIGSENQELFGTASQAIFNIGKKGSDYNNNRRLVGYQEGISFRINPLQDLLVIPEIKRTSSTGGFHTYGSVDAAPAPIYTDETVTLGINYLNNATGEPWEKVTIDMPIPNEKGKDWGPHYTNKALSDVTGSPELTPFEWEGYLENEVKFVEGSDRFDVKYSTSGQLVGDRYESDGWKNWNDVTDKKEIEFIRLELKSGQKIATSESGRYEMEIKVSDSTKSQLDDNNYWRAFRVGYKVGDTTEQPGIGGVVSSRVATSIDGSVFYDKDGDGTFTTGDVMLKDSEAADFIEVYRVQDGNATKIEIAGGTFSIGDLFGKDSKGEITYNFEIKKNAAHDKNFVFSLDRGKGYKLEGLKLDADGKIVDQDNKVYEKIEIGLVEGETATFAFEDKDKALTGVEIKVDGGPLKESYNVYAGYPLGINPTVVGLKSYKLDGWNIYLQDGTKLNTELIAPGKIAEYKMPGGTLVIKPQISLGDDVDEDNKTNTGKLSGKIFIDDNSNDTFELTDRLLTDTDLKIELIEITGGKETVLKSVEDVVEGKFNFGDLTVNIVEGAKYKIKVTGPSDLYQFIVSPKQGDGRLDSIMGSRMSNLTRVVEELGVVKGEIELKASEHGGSLEKNDILIGVRYKHPAKLRFNEADIAKYNAEDLVLNLDGKILDVKANDTLDAGIQYSEKAIGIEPTLTIKDSIKDYVEQDGWKVYVGTKDPVTKTSEELKAFKFKALEKGTEIVIEPVLKDKYPENGKISIKPYINDDNVSGYQSPDRLYDTKANLDKDISIEVKQDTTVIVEPTELVENQLVYDKLSIGEGTGATYTITITNKDAANLELVKEPITRMRTLGASVVQSDVIEKTGAGEEVRTIVLKSPTLGGPIEESINVGVRYKHAAKVGFKAEDKAQLEAGEAVIKLGGEALDIQSTDTLDAGIKYSGIALGIEPELILKEDRVFIKDLNWDLTIGGELKGNFTAEQLKAYSLGALEKGTEIVIEPKLEVEAPKANYGGYIIKYLDEAGKDIVAPVKGQLPTGTKLTLEPIELTGYTTTDSAQTIVIEENAIKEIVFNYTKDGAGEPGEINKISSIISRELYTDTVLDRTDELDTVEYLEGSKVTLEYTVPKALDDGAKIYELQPQTRSLAPIGSVTRRIVLESGQPYVFKYLALADEVKDETVYYNVRHVYTNDLGETIDITPSITKQGKLGDTIEVEAIEYVEGDKYKLLDTEPTTKTLVLEKLANDELQEVVFNYGLVKDDGIEPELPEEGKRVEYIVKYINERGAEIAAPEKYEGEVGTTVVFETDKLVIRLNGVEYKLYGDTVQRLKLKDSDNVIEFKYREVIKEEDKKPVDYSSIIWDWGHTTTPEVKNEVKFEVNRAYLKGYEDGSIKPQGEITRAEVAAIIARLHADVEDIDYVADAKYADVNATAWYAKYVAYVSDKGLMKGYEDGSFKPEEKITRGEYVTVMARFKNLDAAETSFEDAKDHWANEFIGAVAKENWITGYPDGSFKPANNITREEVVTMTNKMLDRKVDEQGIGDLNIKKFTDLQYGTWSYYELVEATNNHEYVRREAGSIVEDWKSIID